MSEYCKEQYKNYIAAVGSGRVSREDFERITGIPEDQCAWRYRQLHGATLRTGGFANLSAYLNRNAAADYMLFARLRSALQKMVDTTYIAKKSGPKQTDDIMKLTDARLEAVALLEEIDKSESETEGVSAGRKL